MRRNTKTMYEWRNPEPKGVGKDMAVIKAVRWYVKGCMRSRGYY